MEKIIKISKAVIKKEGKYLLLKRALYSKSFPGKWDFVGGKHDPGEKSKEAVIRETKEETSFAIVPGEKVKEATYKDKKHNLVFHYYIPKSISGELKLSSDHSKYRWVNKEELKKLKLHPSVTMYFEM